MKITYLLFMKLSSRMLESKALYIKCLALLILTLFAYYDPALFLTISFWWFLLCVLILAANDLFTPCEEGLATFYEQLCFLAQFGSPWVVIVIIEKLINRWAK